MARTAITDNIWEQLQTTMKAHGCHQWKNDRTVMEAILWKLRTGAPWRDIPIELGSWKTAYNRFNRWSKKGLWQKIFLIYEKKLTKNGYSSTEVMYGVVNKQGEVGGVWKEKWKKGGGETGKK
ncbi:transposase [Neisseria meningitidis]|nr:transposase [Neisseria meningitidis]